MPNLKGATNEWTKPTSGYWEEPFWSLGELPSMAHDTVMFDNEGFKALTIGANTTANFPNSLSIRNLVVFRPTNLLLLNYAGLAVPLTISEEFTLSPGASLLSYFSALNAGTFNVDGIATLAERSVATFGTLRLGVHSGGEMNISNALVSSERLFVGDPASGIPGRINHYAGTNRVSGSNAFTVTGIYSTYNLSNGSLITPSLEVVDANFSVSGGFMRVDGGIDLRRGGFLVQGGHIEAVSINFRQGEFTQTAGTNAAGTLRVGSGTQFGPANYVLAGGVLQSGDVALGNSMDVLGVFEQTGGVHTNSGEIRLWGMERTQQNHVQGRYELDAGLLTAGTIAVQGGAFSQTGGTNRVGEIWLDQSASFNLTGGSLESSNCLFRGQIGSLPYYSPSIFVQSNGIHTVQNQLLIEKSTSPFFQRGGVYHLLAGTLLSRFVDVRDRFEQTGGAHTNGQILIVHGSYRLEGGVLLSPYLFVDGRGVFTQNAGTNRADLMYMDISSVFNLQGGTLSTSNSTVSSAYAGSRENRALFVQNGGNHIVKNYLTVDAICRLQGGSLTASNITVYPDGDFFMEGGAINNPGLFTFYDGICFARGQHQNLGRLDVRLGVLARFVQALVSTLDLQNGSTVLRFQDSANLSSQWNGKLSIKNWSGSTNGGGTDQIFVGNNAQGLTTAQLARITFADPPGFPPGNYPARILANGEIVPGARPSLHFIRTSNRLVLSWTGSNQLLTATNLIGPYAPITGATSPYTNLFTDPQRYFLLRSSNP